MIFIHTINIMSDTPPKKIYGWFSEKAHQRADAKITYNTPSGEHVLITNITDSPTDSKTVWDDIMCVGEVTNFVSSVSNLKLFDKRYSK